MIVIVSCDRNGNIDSFSDSKVLQKFDIRDFSVSNFNYGDRVEIDLGDADSIEDRAAVFNAQECTLFICGAAGSEEERALNRRIAFMPGCRGASEAAVKAIMSGKQPEGMGCSGQCSTCGRC